ncbi:DUF3037 domain-containing protein [Polyangium aurulentum]|uniref:DUF3037 domain-containing protein n=1 Tax=Polyangium aurulentum TaxID=2567896 RepID=UPI0010ADF373|nr:DUF3037 domain-containing protein [Polyangium aurulentum]
MPAPSSFDYAIVRVVPRVERGEQVNAGVIVHCHEHDYLAARIELDEARLRMLAPDVDLPLVHRHLEAIPRICKGGRDAGPIGQLPRKERWSWLIAPRSTIIQVSRAHVGLCEAPEQALEKLLDKLVRVERRA